MRPPSDNMDTESNNEFINFEPSGSRPAIRDDRIIFSGHSNVSWDAGVIDPTTHRRPRPSTVGPNPSVVRMHNTAAEPPRQTSHRAVTHRVYTVRCASCETFLTNRGMKAALLLNPNIALYSTDALPTNCGLAAPESLPQSTWDVAPEHVWQSASSSNVPSASGQPSRRSCDCLTQSLLCHGCGCCVGYMIASPCARCNEGIARHRKTATGHRFVFHHNQVVAEQRLYVPHEPGVIPPVVLPPFPTPTLAHQDGASPRSGPSGRSGSTGGLHDCQDHKDGLSYGPATGRSTSPQQHRLPPSFPKALKRGEPLYWHHLQKGGEISPLWDLSNPDVGTRLVIGPVSSGR